MTLLHSFRIKAFNAFQKFGYHITPNHFYEPIPDTRALKPSHFLEPSQLAGIDMNERCQLEMLSALSSSYLSEFDEMIDSDIHPRFNRANGQFVSVDANILYFLARHYRPNRILEVGSGNSTIIASRAVLKNRALGTPTTLTAIEPYPNSVLRGGFDGLDGLIPLPVQDVPLREFERLEENDILFIDSSHVLKTGSDVQYLYLEVLPRLQAGVLVHIHDIFLPYEYPKAWVVDDLRFWNEQYLLQAFLMFNKTFEVVWAGNFMAQKHAGALAENLKVAPGARPGSFWIRKVA